MDRSGAGTPAQPRAWTTRPEALAASSRESMLGEMPNRSRRLGVRFSQSMGRATSVADRPLATDGVLDPRRGETACVPSTIFCALPMLEVVWQGSPKYGKAEGLVTYV
jgi:hypothetical protein